MQDNHHPSSTNMLVSRVSLPCTHFADFVNYDTNLIACMQSLVKDVASNVEFAKVMVQNMKGASDRLQAFASLASTQRSHSERDFHRWIAVSESLGVEPYYLRLRLLHRDHVKEQLCRIPVLPLPLLLHAICCMSYAQFRRSLLGDQPEETVSNFWEKTAHLEWAKRHPGLQRLRDAGLLHRTLPLFFHQDGVEVYRDTEANMWSWGCGLTNQNTVESKFFMTFLWQTQIFDHDLRLAANIEICKFIDWSLKICEEGVGPSKGFYGEDFDPRSVFHRLKGQELFQGWRAIFAGWKGDGKARKQENHFSRAYDSTWICMNCAACQPFKSGLKAPFLFDII